jgi:ribonuclease III
MSKSSIKESGNIVAELMRNLGGIVKIAFNKKRPVRVTERAQIFQLNEDLVDSKLLDFQKRIGVRINNPSYFEQALTHRSYLQIKPNPERMSNERLEFLGDSILGMIVAEYLFDQHKEVQEGELTKMRSWLVNRKSLALCARKLGVEEYILMSFSASQSITKGNDSILADIIEALIAAVYLDSGIESARIFIEETLLPIMVGESVMKDTNFKSILLEYVQSLGKNAPKYVIADEEGPDHDKFFTVGVYVGDDCIGIGSGKSKKDAEQNAARNALEKLS